MSDPFETGKPCHCNEGGICGNCYSHQVKRAEKAEAELKELQEKFEKVNDVRTLALVKFGDEPVSIRVDGVLEFPTFKNLDREMMEKGDE